MLSQLPERENIKKAIRKIRQKHLPPNPSSLADLGELPENFTKTATGDKFLIYDSNNDDEAEENEGRVIVFSTRRNLELLAASLMWFLDGTFKVR